MRLGKLHPFRLGYSHSQVVLGEHLGIFVVWRMRPHDMLAQVDSLDYCVGEVEDIEVDPLRTGRNDDRVYALSRNVVLYYLGTFVPAKKLMCLDHSGTLRSRKSRQFLNIESVPYTTACADVYS